MGRYEVLDTVAVADCAFDVEGRDLGDLFETVARAVAELMVDPATLPVTLDRDVSLSADTLDLLLFDWVSELLFLKDAEQAVFPVTSVTVKGEPSPRLDARLRGGRIDRERTALRADPKALTFHQFALEPRDGGWHARLVIDI